MFEEIAVFVDEAGVKELIALADKPPPETGIEEAAPVFAEVVSVSA
jgi:hypothetical protein